MISLKRLSQVYDLLNELTMSGMEIASHIIFEGPEIGALYDEMIELGWRSELGWQLCGPMVDAWCESNLVDHWYSNHSLDIWVFSSLADAALFKLRFCNAN